VTSHPFARQNADLPHDVDGNEQVTPLDVLVLINWINAQGSGPMSSLPSEAADDSFAFVDVNGDNSISPIDVLVVINYLNGQSSSSPQAAEGEFEAVDHLVPALPRPSSTVQDAEGEGTPTFTQPRVVAVSPVRATEPLRPRNNAVDQAFGQATDLSAPAEWDELLDVLAEGPTLL
jgi:hypothetical protein